MLRKIIGAFLFLVIVGGVLYLVGPRTPVDTSISIDKTGIAADPEAAIARSEANVAGIREGAAKQIVWAFPRSKARTPLAIVYVHGFVCLSVFVYFHVRASSVVCMSIVFDFTIGLSLPRCLSVFDLLL